MSNFDNNSNNPEIRLFNTMDETFPKEKEKKRGEKRILTRTFTKAKNENNQIEKTLKEYDINPLDNQGKTSLHFRMHVSGLIESAKVNVSLIFHSFLTVMQFIVNTTLFME